MKPDFREAAERYAGHTYGPLLPTDTFSGMIDFKAGANHGYSLAMEHRRDFYLMVREYFSLIQKTPTLPREYDKITNQIDSATKSIRKHLAAFTSRELESLPFKD